MMHEFRGDAIPLSGSPSILEFFTVLFSLLILLLVEYCRHDARVQGDAIPLSGSPSILEFFTVPTRS